MFKKIKNLFKKSQKVEDTKRIKDDFLSKIKELEDKNLHKLTKLELEYWRVIKSCKKQALMLAARPGECKSAILETIAKKLELQFIDIRISQIDESVLGVFPYIIKNFFHFLYKNTYFDYAVPKWAKKANTVPTLVVFDEFNRGKLEQRNAALQLLCERRIGSGFKFNDLVFFAAASNLGEEDNCDVDELDDSHKARFIIHKHSVSFDDWCVGYANTHVHKIILEFLHSAPGKLYPTIKNDTYTGYASHRSWSNLSDYITINFGWNADDVNVDEMISDLYIYGGDYVGAEFLSLIVYLNELKDINVGKILKDYESVKHLVKDLNRSTISKLLHNFITFDIEQMKERELDNYILFFKDVKHYHDDDEIIGHIEHRLNPKGVVFDDMKNYPNTKKFARAFPDYFELMKEIKRKKEELKNNIMKVEIDNKVEELKKSQPIEVEVDDVVEEVK